MKIKISIISLLIVILSCSKDKNCQSLEDFGEFNLLPSSVELFQTLQNSKTAVFKDTLGNEFKLNISRHEDYYVWDQQCDIDDNQILDNKDPIVFQASLQKITIRYILDTTFSIDIKLYVWMPINYHTNSKEELITTFADALVIHTRDPTLSISLIGFVNLRSTTYAMSSDLVRQFDNLIIGNRQFQDVYWDDQSKINGINNNITYFNKEFGLVGITNTAKGIYWYLDRIE
jgi:hypothetical protein